MLFRRRSRIYFGIARRSGRSTYARVAAGISEVQCGHRVALIGIVIEQNGHSFETGAAEPGFGRFRLLIARTRRKMENATIRKLMTSVTKAP